MSFLVCAVQTPTPWLFVSPMACLSDHGNEPPRKWWQEGPSLLGPSLVITEVLKWGWDSQQRDEKKRSKDPLGRDHSDQMIKQLRFLFDEALYI